MKRSTFIRFVAPSVIMMLLFIAVPLVKVTIQSFQVTRQLMETKTTENCDPFGCKKEEVSVPLYDDQGLPQYETNWVGLENYSLVLGLDEIASSFEEGGRSLTAVLSNIDFFRALRFTLTFTLITLPLVLILGLLIALSLNSALKSIRGPLIFISLLPFIITPVIGALSIRWLFVGDGIMTAFLEWMLERNISMFAEGWTIEILMMFYRVWHVAPFAFVIFYAGLQTVNRDTLEASIVDGATRFQRFRFVILDHLMPLIVFVSLIHLMDAYRVFEEIVGFSAQAHRISLQYLTYDFLTPDQTGNRSISRASASALLTMVGIVIILIPLLRKTWKEHYGKRH